MRESDVKRAMMALGMYVSEAVGIEKTNRRPQLSNKDKARSRRERKLQDKKQY